MWVGVPFGARWDATRVDPSSPGTTARPEGHRHRVHARGSRGRSRTRRASLLLRGGSGRRGCCGEGASGTGSRHASRWRVLAAIRVTPDMGSRGTAGLAAGRAPTHHVGRARRPETRVVDGERRRNPRGADHDRGRSGVRFPRRDQAGCPARDEPSRAGVALPSRCPSQRRLWRRYLVGNSTFLWLLARERVAGR